MLVHTTSVICHVHTANKSQEKTWFALIVYSKEYKYGWSLAEECRRHRSLLLHSQTIPPINLLSAPIFASLRNINMCSHPCFIVPPYLLESLAQSSDTSLQQLANNTVETTNQIRDERSKLFTEKAAQIFSDQSTSTPQRKIVPDYLLEQLSTGEDVDDSVRESAKKSLQLSQALRAERGEESKTAQQTLVHGPVAFHRSVYDMETSKRDANLPGKPIRLEGQGPAKDPIVNEAYENCLHTLKFFNEKFNWTSFDGKNGVLVSSVHYGQQYGNAAWSYGQMLYGDGDNILGRFTACIDVIGHELTVSTKDELVQLRLSLLIPVYSTALLRTQLNSITRTKVAH